MAVPPEDSSTVGQLIFDALQTHAAYMGDKKLAANRALAERCIWPDWGAQPLSSLTLTSLASWFDGSIAGGCLGRRNAHDVGELFVLGLQHLRVQVQYPGERVLAAFPRIVPEWEQTGAPIGGPQLGGIVAGNAASGAIEAKYGRQGNTGSVAMSLPHLGAIRVWVTDRHLSWVLLRSWRNPSWSFLNIDRQVLSGIEEVPRRRFIQRVGFRFTDGSVARFYVYDGGVVDGLRTQLGAA